MAFFLLSEGISLKGCVCVCDLVNTAFPILLSFIG